MAELARVNSLEFEAASLHFKKKNMESLDDLKAERDKTSGFVNPTFTSSGMDLSIDMTNIHIGNNIMERPKPLEKMISMPEFNYKSHPERSEPAVVVVNACKNYTSAGGVSMPILHNLCMSVQPGTIYSLLGSSGCGKTTLLNCVVGMKHLDSGRILVFGSKTGTRESGVPGRRVGFMPQDIGLYNDFSIKETLNYFGSLYGLKSKEIKSSREFLVDLLNLPEDTQRICQLSGGQKRRVSLAVSLIHSPSLIILDEPTVGVDPLLRENIWKHLLKLVSDGKTTVIITTHYIDEARYSDKVGVMRGGRLLTEKSPKALYDEHHTTSLEEVVLKLCHSDESGSPCGNRARSKSSGNIIVKVEVNPRYSMPAKKISFTPSIHEDHPSSPFNYNEGFRKNLKNSMGRVKSLTLKNASVMTRNIFLLLFVILMPAMQIVIVGMSMGNDPKPLKVGVVNHEFNDTDACNISLELSKPKGECDTVNFSCKFLAALPPDTIHLIYYDTDEEARADVAAGNLWSFMSFPQGYSDFMYERSTSGSLVDNETLQGSQIIFEMDASNAVITKSLQRIIFDSYKIFVQNMLSNCGFNPEIGGLPIKFENPIYGRYDMELKEYIASGMLVGVALFFPLCSSSITYIWDKKQGTMERARVAGTLTWEIMMSYFATEGFVLVGQTCLSFTILTLLFKITIQGAAYQAFLLVLLNGCAGISLGLLLASICTEEIQAILMGLAIVFPNFFLAGAIWPIEGMPLVLQYLSYGLPGTMACEAFRSIVVRGWGFMHFNVWTGFVSTFAWMVVYWIASLYVHKIAHKKK